jgi:hypothetical protein
LQLVGFFIFRQGDFGVLNILGISINTFGGFWYTAAKYQQRLQRKYKESPSPNMSPSIDRPSKGSSNLFPTSSGNLLPLFEATQLEDSNHFKGRENGHTSPLRMNVRRDKELGASVTQRDPAEVLTPGLNIRDRGIVYAEGHRERADNKSPLQAGSPRKGHGRGTMEELV